MITLISRPTINEVGFPGSDGNVWIDYKAPFFGRKIDIVSGHLDYNKTELGVDFDDSSRYNDNDMIGIIMQMNHDWKTGSVTKPHAHWFQNQDEQPNMLIKWRAYNNGDAIPSWTLSKCSDCIFTYPGSGTMLQIVEFPDMDLSAIDSVSGFIDIKLFRDTANTSGLFTGADPYVGNALMKEFDLHVQIDQNGSRQVYEK
jgi:hypothetical protein